MYRQEQVMNWFKEGKTDKKASSLFSENDALYSYGTHFPLAVKINGNRNLKNGQETFLLNGDKHSVSTSAHQNITFSVFSDCPRVSFEAIEAANIASQYSYSSGNKAFKIIDWNEDDYYTLKNAKELKSIQVPIGATILRRKNFKTGKIEPYAYHRVGSVVLRKKRSYFLCSMDESGYFVCKLPHKVNTVEEAFESLIPEEVKMAKGLDVLRQGEWFFIPVGEKVKGITKKSFMKNFCLPLDDLASNRHVVTKGKKLVEHSFKCTKCGYEYNKKKKHSLYVFGTVRHKSVPGTWDWMPKFENDNGDMWGDNTNQHKMLKLVEKMIYKVVKNTALASWSSSGVVD